MTEAKTTWIEKQRFNGVADSGHSIVVDGDKAAGNSPMELVLIGLCGCTGYDVVSILQKKARALHQPRSPGCGRTRPRPTLGLHGNQTDLPRRR
jgi:putative redox protein